MHQDHSPPDAVPLPRDPATRRARDPQAVAERDCEIAEIALPAQHLALRTDAELRACCALVRTALTTNPFSFDSENETEWG